MYCSMRINSVFGVHACRPLGLIFKQTFCKCVSTTRNCESVICFSDDWNQHHWARMLHKFLMCALENYRCGIWRKTPRAATHVHAHTMQCGMDRMQHFLWLYMWRFIMWRKSESDGEPKRRGELLQPFITFADINFFRFIEHDGYVSEIWLV